MPSGNADVQKVVRILLKLDGGDEVQKGIDETYKKSNQGSEQLGRDSKRGSENVEGFMRKWKHQLLAVGTSLGVLWGLAKFSPVAASMITMVGTALGYLASIILMPLLPNVIWFTLELIKLADWFAKLPEPIRIAAAALLGLAAVWAALRVLGMLDLAKKIIFDAPTWLYAKLLAFLAGWNALMAAGGLAGGLAFVAAIATGLALAGVVIWAMLKSGVIDALSKLGQEFEKAHPIVSDILKIWMADFAKLGAVALRIFGTLGAGVKGLVSGDWLEFNAMWTDLKNGAIQRDFAEIDKQRAGAVDRLSKRALGIGVDPYIRPDNPNPTPLNANVGQWLGLTNPTGTNGGMGAAGTSAAMSPAEIEAMKTEARAAGVPEAAINQVLENMGASIDTKGQQWNATMGANLGAVGSTVAANSGQWPATMAANTNAAGTALQTGSAGWVPTVTGATDGINASLKTAGVDWGKTIIDAVWSVLSGGPAGFLKYAAGQMGNLLGGGDSIPSHATGGRVAKTGLALMHEGDWIRSSFGDTTRTGTGQSVQNSGGGGSGTVFSINGPVNVYTQATDVAGIKRDLLRELGGAARRA